MRVFGKRSTAEGLGVWVEKLAPNGPSASAGDWLVPDIAPWGYGVALDAAGGALVRSPNGDRRIVSEVMMLDSAGRASSAWQRLASLPFDRDRTSFQPTWVGAASSAGHHGFVEAGSGTSTYYVATVANDGTSKISAPLYGQFAGIVATPTGYWVSISGSLVHLDRAAVETASEPVTAEAEGYRTCSTPAIAEDGAGGRLFALCTTDGGALLRLANLDAPTHWVDAWYIPGSARAATLHHSPAGSLASVHDAAGPMVLTLDGGGRPSRRRFVEWSIFASGSSGFLAVPRARTSPELLVLDGTGAERARYTLAAGVGPFAATWKDGGLLATETRTPPGVPSNFSIMRLASDGGPTPTASTASSGEFVGLPGLCASTDGGALLHGSGSRGFALRRVSAAGDWIDPATVWIEMGGWLPFTSQCYPCGPSCWVVGGGLSDFRFVRVEAEGPAAPLRATTLPNAGKLGGPFVMAAGADRALWARFDSTRSVIELRTLTLRGAPADGAIVETVPALHRGMSLVSSGGNRFWLSHVMRDELGDEALVLRTIESR